MLQACIRRGQSYGDKTMRTVYVNGEYLPETEATVSIFDRGFLMADGVYEVTSVLGGKLIDFGGHLARLERSLNELDMKKPAAFDDLLEIHRELVRATAISCSRMPKRPSRRWSSLPSPSRVWRKTLLPKKASR